jgi:DNA repair exonuclease SbcCD ATPase subunit
MSTDFFDDDLLQPDIKRMDTPVAKETSTARASTEATTARMAKQKEEISGHVAAAAQEIEQLRMKQEELEREKNKLQELSRKQDEYERGKHDVMEKLDRGIITVEKEEIEATRMVELLSETRNKFKSTLNALRNIKEDSWGDDNDNFSEELNKALAMVENARMDYRKALARIDASSWHKSAAKDQVDALEGLTGGTGIGGGFGFWLKAGLAATLPLLIVLGLCLAAYLVTNFRHMLH